ncbi:MAG: hypothetical protein LBF79_05015, partial [Dysgonamonadaceae bacterium]|nr:hypothetical protein [Dysgonamonadaceae bacterium]
SFLQGFLPQKYKILHLFPNFFINMLLTIRKINESYGATNSVRGFLNSIEVFLNPLRVFKKNL